MQFAGNVLVYGGISPCDGDWFGGITKSNAEQFLDSLINLEVCPAISQLCKDSQKSAICILIQEFSHEMAPEPQR